MIFDDTAIERVSFSLVRDHDDNGAHLYDPESYPEIKKLVWESTKRGVNLTVRGDELVVWENCTK